MLRYIVYEEINNLRVFLISRIGLTYSQKWSSTDENVTNSRIRVPENRIKNHWFKHTHTQVSTFKQPTHEATHSTKPLTNCLTHMHNSPLSSFPHHFIILVSSSCSNSVLSVKRLSMLDSICCRTSSDTTVFSWARLAESMCCRKSLCNSDSPFTNLDWKRKSCDCSDGVWLIN